MITTSHFIWIDLKCSILSNIFIKLFEYLKNNNIDNIVVFQNPLSTHITLYYLENNISLKLKNEIKDFINTFDLNNEIKIIWFDYFYREWNKFVLYLKSKSKDNFKNYRDIFHNEFNRNYILDNNLEFSPHITIFKILNYEIFENHRLNIEKILTDEINKVKNIDLNNKNIHLYAVNSNFKEEIQIKI